MSISKKFLYHLIPITVFSFTLWAPTTTNFFPPINPYQQKIFLGTIQFPQTIANPPLLPLFYKGQEINIELSSSFVPKKGTYEIIENQDCPGLYFLITESLSFPKNSEIIALETSSQHEYRLFKLSMKPKKILSENNTTKTSETLVFTWAIQELDNTKKVIQVPDNSIIFFMNPRFINLQEESWNPSDTVYKLPTIVFDASLDEKTLHVTATRMMLSSVLDFRFLHKKITPITRSAHNRILQVHGPKNRFIS